MFWHATSAFALINKSATTLQWTDGVVWHCSNPSAAAVPAVPASRRHRFSIFQLFSQSRFTAKYKHHVQWEESWRFPMCCFSLQLLTRSCRKREGLLLPDPKKSTGKKGSAGGLCVGPSCLLKKTQSKVLKLEKSLTCLQRWHSPDICFKMWVVILCFPSQTSSVEFPSNSQSETSFWSTKKVPFWLTAFWALSPGVPLWSQWSSASPRVSAALAVDVFARMLMLPSGYVNSSLLKMAQSK